MDYKIELKSLKVYEGISEETTCFKGNLYIDGKLVGYCKNDGRGGSTNIHGNSLEDNKLIQKVDEWCKKNPIPIEGYSFSINSLEDRVDDIVEKELISRDKKKFVNKLNKRMKTHLIFTKENETVELSDITQYYELGWKGFTIESLGKIPNGVKVLSETIERERLKGNRLLNTNLLNDKTIPKKIVK